MQDFIITYEDGSQEVLSHFGIAGMKWGIRRYQNPDGSLTAEGKRRYGSVSNFNKQYAKEKAAKSEKRKENLSKAAHVGKSVAKGLIKTGLVLGAGAVVGTVGASIVSSILQSAEATHVTIGDYRIDENGVRESTWIDKAGDGLYSTISKIKKG